MVGSLESSAISRIVLGQDVLWNSLQHLLREDSKKLPADVQGIKDSPVLVGLWVRADKDEINHVYKAFTI